MIDLTPSPADELVERSNRLGSNPTNTNYGGGNTSAKGAVTDPVSRDDVDVMWVKGSGGDLGTLTVDGLSVLRLDRLRILEQHYVDGEKRYILAPEGLEVGVQLLSGPDAPPAIGNSLLLKNIPLGTDIHNIELQPGRGGVLCRSAGVSATLASGDRRR